LCPDTTAACHSCGKKKVEYQFLIAAMRFSKIVF
jgi:hypothetical protein